MRHTNYQYAVKLLLEFYDGSVSEKKMERDDALSEFNYYVRSCLELGITCLKSVKLVSGKHVRFSFENNLFTHVNY